MAQYYAIFAEGDSTIREGVLIEEGALTEGARYLVISGFGQLKAVQNLFFEKFGLFVATV